MVCSFPPRLRCCNARFNAHCSLALLTATVAFTPGKPALRSTQSAQRASSASMMLYHHEAPMPKVVSDFASLALSKRKAETTPSKEIGQPLESPELEAVNETLGTFWTFSTDEETVDQCMEPTPDGKYGKNLRTMRLYHHEAPMVVSTSASLALSKRKAETTPSKEIGGAAGVNTPGGDRSFDPLGLAPEAEPAE